MPDETEYEETGGARSFWSGTIAFGLVSLPVNLFTANRSSSVSLRMLDQDGTPLARRYFCSQENTALSPDDLVRGYEVEREKFIEIEDDELEAIVPKQSREIDLRRFVPLDEVDPTFFERAYFLVPEEGAIKAYRLLAQSMESMGRAGIATVVMRGKEYLIAIIAERGILRAETLRFYDELRTPGDVGLPSLDKAPANMLDAITKEIKKLSTDTLDRDELTDEPTQRLLALVEQKLEAGEDVMRAPEVPDDEPETAEIIDLMEVLKRSLQGKSTKESTPTEKAKPQRQKPQNGKTTGEKPRDGKSAKKISSTKANEKRNAKNGNRNGKSGKPETQSKKAQKTDIDPSITKAELYEQAKALHIPGRSNMSRDELMRVVQRAR